MTRIFTSYRRADHSDFVERIRDKFVERFGRENVFIDFDSIPPATKWRECIEREIIKCDVLTLFVGPRWLEILLDKHNKFEEDYVSIEIELALRHNKIIAPICIKGAIPPDRNKLPHHIRPILESNMAYIDSNRAFLEDCNRLMDAIEDEVKLHKNNTNQLQNAGHPQKYIENRTARVSLRLELQPEQLQSDELVSLVARLVKVGVEDISIVSIQKGSILITLELPETAADNLKRILITSSHVFSQFGEVSLVFEDKSSLELSKKQSVTSESYSRETLSKGVKRMADMHEINLKVLVMDTDYYALHSINGFLAWDRRTRVTNLSESLKQMWDYIDHAPIAEQPDVVLLEADHLGGPDGLKDVLAHLQRQIQRVRVICLSQVPDADLAEAAAEGGAQGILLKGEVRLQIAWAIVYSLNKEFIVSPGVHKSAESRFNRRLHYATVLPEMRKFPELTERIRQAIQLCVVEGMPAHLAADEMGISLHTIRGYIKEGYRILEAYDETEYPIDMTPQERAFMRFTAFADDNGDQPRGHHEAAN